MYGTSCTSTHGGSGMFVNDHFLGPTPNFDIGALEDATWRISEV